MALFGLDFNAIFSAVKSFLGPFGVLLDKLKQTYEQVTTIFQAGETLRASIAEEINGWKNFKQDIRIKQRVIQIESAITKTRELVEGIPAAYHAIIDAFRALKSQIGETNPVTEAETAAADLETGGVKALLTRFPALARVLERALLVVGLVLQFLITTREVIDDMQTVVDELKRLRLEIERLDTIFLPQSNKRKTLRLADGSTIRIRLGKLHS